MEIEIKVAHWAQEEERPEWLLFLSFLYELASAYGFGSTFIIDDHDLRIILGQTYFDCSYQIAEQPWGHKLVVGSPLKEKTSIKVPKKRGANLGPNSVTKKLTTQREIMIYLYLQGCFNNNLIEPDGHKRRMGLPIELKQKLKHGLFQSE